jgi:hypothetical protein
MREAVEFGLRRFYVSYDPYPNGDYYFELFRRIRQEKLDVDMIFGCWGLPSGRFLDEFRDTFRDGMFEVSPETSDEQIRKVNKGPLSFSNRQLLDCLDEIRRRDLVCQLFFGYFLAGDTAETVMKTRRFARDLESAFCETFYLAFSTDPGSYYHLQPAAYDMDVKVHGLEDFMRSLAEARLSPNLLAHRPRSMTEDEANNLVITLNTDQFVHKVLPRSIEALGALAASRQTFHVLMERFCSNETGLFKQRRGELAIGDLIDAFQRFVQTEIVKPDGLLTALASEMVRYEAMPYVLMEKHFAAVSRHYASYCSEAELSGEPLRQFLHAPGNVVETRDFQYDLKRAFKAGTPGEVWPTGKKATSIGLALNRGGVFVTFYADAPGTATEVP